MTNLVHFKATKCNSIDPEKVCTDIFSKNHRYMCVAHPKSKKKQAGEPHWHFQGVSSLSEKELDGYITAMSVGHAKRSMDPKSRPIKRVKKDVDEKGYQYMIRHGVESVVVSHMFTGEELAALVEASDDYVQEMKDDCLNHLDKYLSFTGTPERIHKAARLHAIKFYKEQDKLWPPNIQKLILYWMMKLGKDKSNNLDELLEYISERM